MQIKVVQKADRHPHVKLIVIIYEKDYLNFEQDRHVCYPTIENYSAFLRFVFTNGALYASVRKYPYFRYNPKVKLHIRCERLDYAKTFMCPAIWSDWSRLGELPLTETSASDGKMHVFKIYLNLCEIRNICFVNLFYDSIFYDVFLLSDDYSAGSVGMHRAVLSAHSSMMRSIILSRWNGEPFRIQIHYASHQTLLCVKQYIYMGFIDKRYLVQLMDLAKRYSFEHLFAECVFAMSNRVDSQNLLEYRQLATDLGIPELLNALQHITTDELAVTTSTLEMLNVTQVKGTDTDTQRREPQRQDSNTQRREPQRQDSNTQRREPQRQDSNTQRREPQRQDSNTQRREPQRQDSNTQRRESEKQDSHSQRKKK